MAARSIRLNVQTTPTDHGVHLAASLPPCAAGAWCAVRLRVEDGGPATGQWWAKLSLADASRGQVVREVFLGPLHRSRRLWQRATLVHVPADSASLTIEIFGSAASRAGLDLRVLSRAGAGLRLAWHGAGTLPAALLGSPLGLVGRVRALIGQAPGRGGQAPPYAAWIRLFERPPNQEALETAQRWDVQAAVIDGLAGPLAASLASAAGQLPGAMPVRVIAAPADWGAVSAEWVVIMQAGETLAPGARAAFAQAAAICPWADVLTADCDTWVPGGERADPLFKPGPDSLLPLSGLPAQGALAVRRDLITPALPLHAHTARAALLRGAIGRIAHIPGIQSHRPGIEGAGGTRVHHGAQPSPSVTILIPSAARAAHVLRCLHRVARGTAYEDFSIKLVLAAPARARTRVCRAAARLPRVSILPLDVSPFNYARVNNEAARDCNSELLLLMNDDVAPIAPGWLAAMAAHMQDPRVGIVGARLLYGNGMVQHEGVIMGLANLCEHAGRLRDGADPGGNGIGLLDREVCAVTGACLLIRSRLYSELGGMDEAYAIALNDVDLCLRAREAGWRVVYCADAVLHHYESLSLGRHYSGGRARLESLEVRRLRGRFADVIGADPHYNPLAALQPGREWQPAFPPRAHPPARGAPTL